MYICMRVHTCISVHLVYIQCVGKYLQNKFLFHKKLCGVNFYWYRLLDLRLS